MVVGDGQGGVGGLAVERRCQPDAAVHIGTVGVAMLRQQLLTCTSIK